jgi:hypothetical protein
VPSLDGRRSGRGGGWRGFDCSPSPAIAGHRPGTATRLAGRSVRQQRQDRDPRLAPRPRSPEDPCGASPVTGPGERGAWFSAIAALPLRRAHCGQPLPAVRDDTSARHSWPHSQQRRPTRRFAAHASVAGSTPALRAGCSSCDQLRRLDGEGPPRPDPVLPRPLAGRATNPEAVAAHPPLGAAPHRLRSGWARRLAPPRDAERVAIRIAGPPVGARQVRCPDPAIPAAAEMTEHPIRGFVMSDLAQATGVRECRPPAARLVRPRDSSRAMLARLPSARGCRSVGDPQALRKPHASVSGTISACLVATSRRRVGAGARKDHPRPGWRVVSTGPACGSLR